MSDLGDELVSRSDIARLAGVRRPAVTNWERRHQDFPAPVAQDAASAEPEAFRAADVLEWLSSRTIPSNALRLGEPKGTTYGDRFRSALTGGRSGRLLTAVEQLAGSEADRYRGSLRLTDYLYLLLCLVFVRVTKYERWTDYRDEPWDALKDFVWSGRGRPGPDEGLDPGKEFSVAEMAAVLEFLDRNPPTRPGEGREAFDRLLGLFRDADARAGAEFFTPPSVSRVMACALASHRLPAESLHDPFCRTGELLAAYLDAVREQGDPLPPVTGQGPVDGELGLAWRNVRLHGARSHRFTWGPAKPADGPLGRAGTFDAVLTNPPFGDRLPANRRPQPYWRYVQPRTAEADWLQYVISLLAPEGRAAVLMPAGVTFRAGAEEELRTRMVEDGVVECVMALPAQLFELTAIKTHVWFLRPPRGRAEPVLFVSGAHLGHMASRTRRVLSDSDIGTLVEEYASWVTDADSRRNPLGTPGLSRAVPPEEIAANDHQMDPGVYVRTSSVLQEGSAEPAAVKDRLSRLSREIDGLHEQVWEADLRVEEQIRRYGL